MTRDNWLFVVIGILVGFVAGYLMQEVMGERQPQRLVHGDDGSAVAAPDGAPVAEGRVPAEARAQGLLQEMQSLESYVAQNPDDADALLRLASLRIETGSWAGCVESFERLLELRSPTPDLLSDMGICYRGVGRVDRALELFDRAQEIEPRHWQSRFYEAMVLGLDQRDFEAADRVLDELRALRPGDPQVERLAQEIERQRSA